MEYISREDYCEENCGKENREGYKTCKNCGMLNIPSADVQPVNQWISCKEQMPEDGISILICSERGTISKATYDSDMGYFYIADSELHYNQLDITHWQPLPQPPKDGDSK